MEIQSTLCFASQVKFTGWAFFIFPVLAEINLASSLKLNTEFQKFSFF